MALSAAATYAPRNVRISCVAPGLTRTPMTARITGGVTPEADCSNPWGYAPLCDIPAVPERALSALGLCQGCRQRAHL
jgi:NAD(P)-dependent dehydrogenase (short-subunit alcohol dehydrogenase family)